MGKVALIANARSHRVARKGARLEAVAGRCPDLPLVWFEDTRGFTEAVCRLLETGHDTFLVEGGDGTVLATLTACHNHAADAFSRLRFALLPGGSTNLAFTQLGIINPTVDRVTALVSSLRASQAMQERTRRQPVLLVERAGTDNHQAGFLLSTGALALGMEHVQRHLFGPGRRGAAAVAAALLRLGARPRHYRAADGAPLLRPTNLELKRPQGEVESGPHAFTLVSVLNSLSLGIRPFWGTGTGAIGCTYAPWPPASLRCAILRSLAGLDRAPLERQGYRSFRADQLVMTVRGLVMLDGELLGSGAGRSLRIMASEPVRFIR